MNMKKGIMWLCSAFVLVALTGCFMVMQTDHSLPVPAARATPKGVERAPGCGTLPQFIYKVDCHGNKHYELPHRRKGIAAAA